MVNTPQSPNSGMTFGIDTINNSINSGKKVISNNWTLLAIVFFFHILNVGINLTFIGIPINFPGMHWFNGLNITYLWKTPQLAGSVLYTNTILNTTFWVLIIVIFVFGRGKSWEEFGSKVLMVVAFVAVSIFSGIYNIGDIASLNVLGTVIEIILIIVIRNVIFKQQYNIVEANYYTILIIFLDFYLINIVQLMFPAQIDVINRVILPVLVLTVIVYMESSTLKSWFIFGILFFYLIFFMTSSPSIKANFNAGFKGAEKDATPLQTFSEKVKIWWAGTLQSYNESKQMLSGDYYTGQVEQNQVKPLGVFLEDMKGDTEFLQNEKIEIWSKLKVQSLQNDNSPETDPININVSCFIKNGTGVINGIISPKSEFKVNSYEEEFLTCSFNNINLSPGYYPVTFNASFNFETQSYLKTYYIDKDKKRTLMANNVNILSSYGISDTSPVAVYTNGPIKIGMETTPPPIGVPSINPEADFSSYIGITIDKNWGEGSLKSIKELWIELPEGLSFNDCPSFENLPQDKWDTKNGDKSYVMISKYQLNNSKISTDNKKGFTLPKSYKCSLKLKSRNDLLGQTPIAIKYFKTRISYDYMITKTTNINIRSIN